MIELSHNEVSYISGGISNTDFIVESGITAGIVGFGIAQLCVLCSGRPVNLGRHLKYLTGGLLSAGALGSALSAAYIILKAHVYDKY